MVFNAWNNLAPFLSNKDDVFSPILKQDESRGKHGEKEQYNEKREKVEEKRLADLRGSGAGCDFWFQPSRQSQAGRTEPRNSGGGRMCTALEAKGLDVCPALPFTAQLFASVSSAVKGG